jgi:hypothetical protein
MDTRAAASEAAAMRIVHEFTLSVAIAMCAFAVSRTIYGAPARRADGQCLPSARSRGLRDAVSSAAMSMSHPTPQRTHQAVFPCLHFVFQRFKFRVSA